MRAKDLLTATYSIVMKVTPNNFNLRRRSGCRNDGDRAALNYRRPCRRLTQNRGGLNKSGRKVLLDPLMGPRPIVVKCVLRHDFPQVRLVQDQHLVQTRSLLAADEPFANRLSPGCGLAQQLSGRNSKSWTTVKSQTQISLAWFFRKVAQFWPVFDRLAGRYRTLADPDPELEEFAPDSLGTP